MSKAQKSIIFAPNANSEEHKFLGKFLDPDTPKIALFAFGQTFPFWGVLGATSAPEAKNENNCTFCSQKCKIVFLRFWSKKGARNVVFVKGFALLAKVSANDFPFLT